MPPNRTLHSPTALVEKTHHRIHWGSNAILANVTVALIATLASPWPSAQAQESAQASSPWGVIAAAGTTKKPYRGIDNDAYIFPLPTYENSWLSYAGTTADIKFPNVGSISFRLRARYGFGDGYDASDSSALSGMADRDPAFWIGGAMIWKTPLLNVAAEWVTDAERKKDSFSFGGSNGRKGQKVSVVFDRTFAAQGLYFTPRLGAAWMDSRYVDYYYGVTGNEARIGRATYRGKSTTNIDVGLRVSYPLTPKQNIFVDVSHIALGDGVKDSPIVDSSSQQSISVGYFHKF